VYPYWYDIPYQFRPTSTIVTENDDWFIRKMNSEEEAKNWKIIMQKILQTTQTDYTKQNFLNDTIFTSKSYNLGK
jgi:hypothetical protein